MKILHTSDWHLGNTLYNYDRTFEQQDFLQQLARIVEEEKPDAMVVSGDVYHHSSPSAFTQKMYTEGMLNIHRACPEMTIVVTAGNHDSSARLEIDSSLWHHFGLKVVGSIGRTSEGIDWEKHIIEVKRGGTVKGFIVAVPHVYSHNFPAMDANTPSKERQTCFFQTLLDKVRTRNRTQLPVVMMAHLSITGSDRIGHTDSIGNMELVPLNSLGEGYDYLALGHIHCPQDIKDKNHHARYCGTPIPVNFDETYPHSVSVVEMERGEEPRISIREIENPIPLITLPREPVPFEEALKLLDEFPKEKSAYIRLNVLTEGYLPPDCNEKASNAAKGKNCKYCYIKINRIQPTASDETKYISVQDIQEISPIEIAKLYFREENGEEMDTELCQLLETVVERVAHRNKL